MIDTCEPSDRATRDARERDSFSPSFSESREAGAGRWNRALLAALGLVAVALIALVAIQPNVAYDLWWQLKAGELILRQHSIPHADVFSHTAPGHLWVLQEWLTE